MTMSTPNTNRKDEDLPGSGAMTGRRRDSGPGARRTKSKGGKRRARLRGPLRTLVSLLVITFLLFGGLGAARLFADPAASLTPQLGLDLAGGRQIVMEPLTEEGANVSNEQLDQAIDIIRRRVDGGGVTEAEVTRMGQNISVAIPGNPTADQVESLSRSSQLRFRPVLVAEPAIPAGEQVEQRSLPLPPSVLEPLVEEQREAQEEAERQAEESVEEGTTDEAEQTEENRGGTRLPTSNEAVAGGTDGAGETEEPLPIEEPLPDAETGDPSSLAQVTPELQQEFEALQCTTDGSAANEAPEDLDTPSLACNVNGTEKYILGPVELTGSSITDATASAETVQSGTVTGRWQVVLSFDADGGATFADVTLRLFGYPQGSAQNRFAMVLDNEVISAPSVNNVISNGVATITGNFTPEESQNLANQLKFGALPLSFEVQTSEQISPTLGGEQLRYGVIAGAVGLLLVFAFMLVQYHALGLVAIGSLLVAGLLAYGSVTLLGWANNFRLTMAGVTGLIVAIGITADSFIVYFERIRDEVRAGRPLRYAVDTGWERARRTLIISDVVNLLAAVVLYLLSESGVKAFAFALGLTTVIDLIVVFMFTHPVVSILANTRFFGEGKKWSGMEPERLGAKRSAYLGRGRVSEPDEIPAGRRRHSREELEGGVV